MEDRSGYYPLQGPVDIYSPPARPPTQTSENCHRCLRRDHRKAMKRMYRRAMIMNQKKAEEAAKVERDAAVRRQVYEMRIFEKEAKEYGAMRASMEETYGSPEM